MSIPDFKPGQTFDFYRTFFTVDKVDGRIEIHTKELNFVQRAIRSLFHWAGAYDNTFLTTKDITDFAKQEGIQLASIPKDEPLYKQILAIKRIAEANKTTPLPTTSSLSSADKTSSPATLKQLKESVQALIKNYSKSTSPEMINCLALLEKLDCTDVPTALLSLVAAGEKTLTAAKQAAQEEDAKNLGALAKDIATTAQKAVHISKNEAPVEAAQAANKLAADVRVHLKTQNVVIVGKSRSGKTTLMNMVKDVCHIGGEMTMYYGTAKPKLHKSTTQGWNFNTLDTPGWLETVDSTSGKKKRTDETIVELIRDEATKNLEGDAQDPFQNVDTFIFTFNIQEGMDAYEVDSLKEFLDKLPQGKKTILAITRFENALKNERSHCIDQLKADKIMGNLLATHFEDGKNVLLSGCLEKSQFFDRSKATNMEETLNQQSQALMAALLPESAKGRTKFLLDHAKANEEWIKQFTANDFEREREECLLSPGQYAIDEAGKALADAQKALVEGKLPQSRVTEFKEAASKLEALADEIVNMKEIVEREVVETKVPNAIAKARALLDKITAQQEQVTQAIEALNLLVRQA